MLLDFIWTLCDRSLNEAQTENTHTRCRAAAGPPLAPLWAAKRDDDSPRSKGVERAKLISKGLPEGLPKFLHPALNRPENNHSAQAIIRSRRDPTFPFFLGRPHATAKITDCPAYPHPVQTLSNLSPSLPGPSFHKREPLAYIPFVAGKIARRPSLSHRRTLAALTLAPPAVACCDP